MEAENRLTITREISSEIFFKEEAFRFREAFNSKNDEQDLYYLRHQLEGMKRMATQLELPWERYIPILFRSFANYMRHPDANASNSKTYQLTALLMECVTFLSQNKPMINALATIFDQQIKDLDKLMGNGEAPVTE